jgi:hypothetical protein
MYQGVNGSGNVVEVLGMFNGFLVAGAANGAAT